MTTAHPESVVGRLRAALDKYEAEPFDTTRTEPSRIEWLYDLAASEHAPALLAALEKVWDEVDGCGPDEIEAAAVQVRTILAPLFKSPETFNHD